MRVWHSRSRRTVRLRLSCKTSGKCLGERWADHEMKPPVREKNIVSNNYIQKLSRRKPSPTVSNSGKSIFCGNESLEFNEILLVFRPTCERF